MANTIKIKNSGTASAVPGSLEHGELGLNYADGKIFFKNLSNTITEFTTPPNLVVQNTAPANTSVIWADTSVTGVGVVPTGGTTGQVLSKASNTNYDAAWANAITSSDLALKANIASPTFTGTVTIPAGASISGFAPLANAALTGTPTAPTATVGTNTTQLATTEFVTAADQVTTPSGAVIAFAGSTAPTNWLLCYGQAISRTTYATLFAVISTTYGAGDGTTTFNLPDLRGRSVAGVDNMGGTDAGRLDIANSSGVVVGSQYVTLTAAQSGLPAHSHASTASFSGSFTGTAASHGHSPIAHSHSGYTSMGAYTNFLRVVGVAGTTMENNHAVGRGGGSYADYAGDYPNHQHSLSIDAANASVNDTSITPAGSIAGTVTMTNPNNAAANASSAVSLMQPTMVLNYIIKV